MAGSETWGSKETSGCGVLPPFFFYWLSFTYLGGGGIFFNV